MIQTNTINMQTVVFGTLEWIVNVGLSADPVSNFINSKITASKIFNYKP